MIVVADPSCAHSTGGGVSVAADFQAGNSRETMPQLIQRNHPDIAFERRLVWARRIFSNDHRMFSAISGKARSSRPWMSSMTRIPWCRIMPILRQRG